MPSTDTSKKPLVAILNTSAELLEALESAIQAAGYDTATTTIPELKQGQTTLKKIFKGRVPAVIVYDVALPYKENWEYIQKIRSQTKEVKDARFIFTTTNKRALETLIGQESYAFEITGIIDKPFDLDELMEDIKTAVKEVQKERDLTTKE